MPYIFIVFQADYSLLLWSKKLEDTFKNGRWIFDNVNCLYNLV